MPKQLEPAFRYGRVVATASASRTAGKAAPTPDPAPAAPAPPAKRVSASRKSRPVGHLVGYARVSTLEQDPALQLDALTQAGCGRVFTDHASGSREDRPQLAAALDHVRAGDTLVVWRLDRLGRSLPHLIDTVTGLQGRGVGFRSVTEAIDTTTAGGRLVFHLFGALAEFERQLIRDRTLAGLAAARARGRVGGRPRTMTAAKLRLARSMRAQTPPMSLGRIATELGVSKTTVARNLAAPDPGTAAAGVATAAADGDGEQEQRAPKTSTSTRTSRRARR